MRNGDNDKVDSERSDENEDDINNSICNNKNVKSENSGNYDEKIQNRYRNPQITVGVRNKNGRLEKKN